MMTKVMLRKCSDNFYFGMSQTDNQPIILHFGSVIQIFRYILDGSHANSTGKVKILFDSPSTEFIDRFHAIVENCEFILNSDRIANQSFCTYIFNDLLR
jgi:hypothetical protein